METQPTKQAQVPIVPPPQTVEGFLSSSLVQLPPTKSKAPFGPPNLDAMLSRLYYTPRLDFSCSVDTLPNARLVTWQPYEADTNTGESTISRPYRFTSWHAAFVNHDIVVTFYAVKAPLVTGRIGIFYNPVNDSDAPAVETLQRNILKEWDLAATNVCQVTIPGLLTSQTRANDEVLRRDQYVRYPVGQYHSIYDTPFSITSQYESNFGRLTLLLLNSLQIGSLYPNTIQVYGFVSFNNVKLTSLQGFTSFSDHLMP